QLNAEAEERVYRRTEQLDSTTRRLEREVQEHQQAIEEMRESDRRLQEVLDHAMAAIYLRDADGRYLLVNRYWEALAGRRAEDVVGKNIEEIMPPEGVAAVEAHNSGVLDSCQNMQFEVPIQQQLGLTT